MLPHLIIKSDKILNWWSKINGFKVGAFTLPLIILARHISSNKLLNHERIHITQQYECMVLGSIPFLLVWYFNFWAWATLLWVIPVALGSFFVIYGVLYLQGRLHGYNHHEAYMNILFEIEAYKNEDDLDYLKNRKPFSWLRLKNTVN